MPTYLLTNRGTPKDKTLEGARKTHNQTSASGQAVARSFGDLTHTVYVPVEGFGTTTNELDLLLVDVWNSVEGLNRFFAKLRGNEQVSPIFARNDPAVWSPAEGFDSYHFQAPYGKNERILGLVRGVVRSRADAQAMHNDFMEDNVGKARLTGILSHEAYVAFTPPGRPESLELLALDVWMDVSLTAAYYQDAEWRDVFQKIFVEPPSVSTWIHPVGDWAEW